MKRHVHLLMRTLALIAALFSPVGNRSYAREPFVPDFVTDLTRPPPTAEQIAAVEAAFNRILLKYAADLEAAYEAYSAANSGPDSVSAQLAVEQLYYDELRAELNFWNTTAEYLSVLGVGVWGWVTFKVGQDFAKHSPVVQGRVAGLVAMLGAASALVVAKIVSDRQEHYKALVEVQRKIIDERLKYILWQEDYGGAGQPPPSSDLEALFPGCRFEYICGDAWVCATQNGIRDCEKQTKCANRIISCL